MMNENAQNMRHDRCFFIISFLLKQHLRAEPLQAKCGRAVARPTTFEQAGAHTKLHALVSFAPRKAKSAKSSRATKTDAYAKQSLCVSRSNETGAAGHVGRPSGSAAAGVLLHIASLLTPSTNDASHPTQAN